MLRRSFYHFVNSPVGIFVQNALVIVWVFVYPSLFTMLLLLCSTINMMCVKASDIEGYVVISPQLWTQRIFMACFSASSTTCSPPASPCCSRAM